MGNTNWNYVIAAVEEMNFTKAAKRLYISQQSLSNYIAKLEKQFGVEFFNRKNTLTLTTAGESLYRYAKQITAMEEQARKEICDIRDFKTSILRIGISMHRGTKMLPKILPELKKWYPDVRIELMEKSLRELHAALLEGKIDITFAYARGENEQFAEEIYAKERLMLVIPDYIWKKFVPEQVQIQMEQEEFAKLEMFSNCPFVCLTEKMWLQQQIEKYFTEHGLSLQREIRTSNIETMVGLSIAGMGAMVCPEIYLRPEYISGRFNTPLHMFEIVDMPEFYRAIIYGKNRYLPKIMKDFITLVKKYGV
ncbi:CysJI operon transcriptional activator [uncultured Clostridium sp.]|jgi:DNA-binding transcriptional LysR family regulator|nr:CysJI operon transcriptional activator [uncultured Clostridium sp.]